MTHCTWGKMRENGVVSMRLDRSEVAFLLASYSYCHYLNSFCMFTIYSSFPVFMVHSQVLNFCPYQLSISMFALLL